MTEALKSSTTMELLFALFRIIKPALLVAVKSYMNEAQPLVDEPSIHMLRHQLIDRERQLEWGEAAIAELSKGLSEENIRETERWAAYLDHLLNRAGRVDGTGEREEPNLSFVVEREEFILPARSTRDIRFRKATLKFEGMNLEESEQGRLRTMLYHRFFEMSPAEGIARVHFLSENKPWAFYYDTARHLWDEVRHSWFGEAALRVKGEDIYVSPNWVGWHDMAADIFNLEETYTHLTIAIEKAGMKYPPGKREEWEFCRDIVRDPLMTTFQDFDWADEVTHAGYGQKWVVDSIYGGDVRKAMEEADETVRRRQEYMDQFKGNKPENDFAGSY